MYERNDGRSSFCLNLTLQCASLLIVRHVAMRGTCVHTEMFAFVRNILTQLTNADVRVDVFIITSVICIKS